MSRLTRDAPGVEEPSLRIHHHHGLHPWFTPTHLIFQAEADHDAGRGLWTSRRARKARCRARTRAVHSGRSTDDTSYPSVGSVEQKAEAGAKEAVLRFEDHRTSLKLNFTPDVTFWLAFTFVVGSMVWVVNGGLLLFPLLSGNEDEILPRSAAAMAFIGGSIFNVGSYLMVLEALNRGTEIDIGTALGGLLHQHRLGRRTDTEGVGKPQSPRGFRWWGKPMWHDIGYCALCAASVFWISTLTGLPGVIPGLLETTASVPIADVFFWTPQVIGGSGFMLSSILLMLEVQRHWYLPAFNDLGWWIGFWNLVGAVGFLLCGAFGYAADLARLSALSTWWGSWAFLIGSTLQVGEALYREK